MTKQHVTKHPERETKEVIAICEEIETKTKFNMILSKNTFSGVPG